LINKIGFQGEKAKQKKMQKVLEKEGHVLKEMYERLQKNGECKFCGTLPADKPADFESEDKKKMICENCDELIKIGGKLLRADKIILKTGELSRFHEMVRLVEEDDKEFGYLTEYKAGSPLMSLPYAAPFKNKNELCNFNDIAKK